MRGPLTRGRLKVLMIPRPARGRPKSATAAARGVETGVLDTPNLPTNIVDFGGPDSRIILI